MLEYRQCGGYDKEDEERDRQRDVAAQGEMQKRERN